MRELDGRLSVRVLAFVRTERHLPCTFLTPPRFTPGVHAKAACGKVARLRDV